MNASHGTHTERVEAHARRRPRFGAGLATGLVGGALVGIVLTVVSLMLAPDSLLDAVRVGQSHAPTVIDVTPSPSPTPLPTAEWPDADTAVEFEVTQPGAVVALGEPARLLLASASGDRAVVEVTTLTVEPAPTKDQRALRDAAPALTGQTVYYARLSARWLDGDAVNSASVADLFTLISADGTAIPSLTLLDWRPCESPATPGDFDTETEPTSWCVAAASPTDGLVPVGLRFSQPGGPYDSPTADAGVRWTP